MSIGTQRRVNVCTFKLEEHLLPKVRKVRINPIKISGQEDELISTVLIFSTLAKGLLHHACGAQGVYRPT